MHDPSTHRLSKPEVMKPTLLVTGSVGQTSLGSLDRCQSSCYYLPIELVHCALGSFLHAYAQDGH